VKLSVLIPDNLIQNGPAVKNVCMCSPKKAVMKKDVKSKVAATVMINNFNNNSILLVLFH